MENHFTRVKNFLQDLEYQIVSESQSDGIFTVEKESNLIKGMVIDIEEPILVLEQMLFEVKSDKPEMYKTLLQKNRDIIHGAFVLDETGKKVLFRDTLQIESLDLNELEASLNSLTLLLTEFGETIIAYSK